MFANGLSLKRTGYNLRGPCSILMGETLVGMMKLADTLRDGSDISSQSGAASLRNGGLRK